MTSGNLKDIAAIKSDGERNTLSTQTIEVLNEIVENTFYLEGKQKRVHVKCL